MAEPNDSKDNRKDGGKPKPTFSPFSPFPYGSPLAQGLLQTSFTGSPGQKILLGESVNHSRTNGEVVTPRLKGQDLYGGPVMFGGVGSSRRTRLQSASPYNIALRGRNAERKAKQGSIIFPPALGAHNNTLPPPPSSLPSTAPSSPQSSPGPSSSPPAPLSSTAKLILSTLDKLSTGGTPITDAKRIPVNNSIITPNRAEKRKLIESELNCSLSSPSRRRARLGGGGVALSLNGPPLRKNYSPCLGSSERLASSGAKSKDNSIEMRIPNSLPEVDSSSIVPSSLAERLGQGVLKETSNVKSSFKLKTKVTDAVRLKSDNLETDLPPVAPTFSGFSQLKVDKLPVLDLNPDSTPKKSETMIKANGFPAKPVEEEIEVERNNNTTKRILEEEKDISPKKQKSESNSVPVKTFPSTSLSLFNSVGDDKSSDATKKDTKNECTLSNAIPPSSSSNIISENSTSANGVDSSKSTGNNLITKNTSLVGASPIKFSFTVPKPVIVEELSVKEAAKNYSFRVPTNANRKNESRLDTNGPSEIGKNSSPNFRVGSGAVNSYSNINTNFKFNNLSAMPDVTNNLVMKKLQSRDRIKGSNSRLPDITASTGFGGFIPAKELKTGSVMDILGKKA